MPFLLLFQLPHAPIGSRLVRTDFDGVALALGIATTNPNASCPACGHENWRVHSRYCRCLAKEPVFGHRVRLRMTGRRFLCPSSGCPHRIFAEPLHGFATRYARTINRLAQAHLAIGSALGGSRSEAGGEDCRADQHRYVASTRQAGGGIGPRVPHDSSASTAEPGVKDRDTAPSLSASRRATSSISCRIAMPQLSVCG